MVVRFVLQMLHFAVGVIDERALFGQTLYMLQYQSVLALLRCLCWFLSSTLAKAVGGNFNGMDEVKSTSSSSEQA